MKLCSTPGCGRKHYAHGLCQSEYLADRRAKAAGAKKASSQPPALAAHAVSAAPPRFPRAPAPAPATFLAAGSLLPADGPAAVIVDAGTVAL